VKQTRNTIHTEREEKKKERKKEREEKRERERPRVFCLLPFFKHALVFSRRLQIDNVSHLSVSQRLS
jgi:hypothetical protein